MLYYILSYTYTFYPRDPTWNVDMNGNGYSACRDIGDFAAECTNAKWEFELGTFFGGALLPPAIDYDGFIYTNYTTSILPDTYSTTLIALTRDGTVKWKSQEELHYTFPPPPVIDYTNKKLYLMPGVPQVQAYDLTTGTLLWNYSYGSGTFFPLGSPAIETDGGTIYATTDDSFFAILPDGTVKWQTFSYPPFYSTSPCIRSDNTIYVAGRVFNPDGTQNFTAEAGCFPISPTIARWELASIPTIGYDIAVFGENTLYGILKCSEGEPTNLIAINTLTNEVKFVVNLDFPCRIASSLVLTTSGNLYVLDGDLILRINSQTGVIENVIKIGGINDDIYGLTISYDGEFYAYRVNYRYPWDQISLIKLCIRDIAPYPNGWPILAVRDPINSKNMKIPITKP